MINSQPGSRDYKFHKYCEVEVRNFIKYMGGANECLEWHNSIPEEGRRYAIKDFWDALGREDDAVYVPWNDHTYEYFQEKIGAKKPYVPANPEDSIFDAVWDDTDIFQF